MRNTRLLVIDTENQCPYDFSGTHPEPSDARSELLFELSEIQKSGGIDIYIAQSNYPGISDSPDGIRFLNFNPDRLPEFGELDYIVAIGAHGVREKIRATYPDTEIFFWPPKTQTGYEALLLAVAAA